MKLLIALIFLKVIILSFTTSEEVPTAICLAEGSRFHRPTISFTNSSFLGLLTSGNLFVDKTLFIKHLLDYGNQTYLIAAPNKMGKTINLNMLKTFFEIVVDAEGNPVPRQKTNNYKFFSEGRVVINYVLLMLQNPLLISQHKDIIDRYLGKHPVIYLDLSSVTVKTVPTFMEGLKTAIGKTFKQHDYLLKILERKAKEDNDNQTEINEITLNTFSRILSIKNSTELDVITSIRLLSALLEQHFNALPIILIDEYDLPINKMVVDDPFMRKNEQIRDVLQNLLQYSIVKNNKNFKMAVLTGSVTYAEGIVFSSMANISNNYVFLDQKLSPFFGFNEVEVQRILDVCRIAPKLQYDCHQHYGYVGFQQRLYNPFTVARFVAEQKLVNEWRAASFMDTFITKVLWYTSFQNLLLNFVYGDSMEINLQNMRFTKRDQQNIIGVMITRKSNPTMTPDEKFSVVRFLCYSGYLTEISKSSDVSVVGCPCEEIRMTLKRRLLRYYQSLQPSRLSVKELERVNILKSRLHKEHKVFQHTVDRYFFKNYSYEDRMMLERFIRLYSKVMSNFTSQTNARR